MIGSRMNERAVTGNVARLVWNRMTRLNTSSRIGVEQPNARNSPIGDNRFVFTARMSRLGKTFGDRRTPPSVSIQNAPVALPIDP